MNPKITKTLKYSAIGIGVVGVTLGVKHVAEIVDSLIRPAYIVNGSYEGKRIREGGDWWRRK